MENTHMASIDMQELKHALVPGVINGVINGWISWGTFSALPAVALSVDSIATGATSAIGNAVMMATALGLILSLINFGMARKAASASKPGVYRAALAISFKNAFFLFGLFVAVGVLWQRVMGTVEVSPATATAFTAAVALGVSVYLYYAVRDAHAVWARHADAR